MVTEGISMASGDRTSDYPGTLENVYFVLVLFTGMRN